MSPENADRPQGYADHAGEWWYCLRHHRVEPWEGCKNADRLGPYASREEAAHALDKVAQRNESWDEEDARWNGDEPSSGSSSGASG